MIDRALLDRVTHVVTHASCPDGIASAVLLHDALEDTKVEFVSYGTPDYENLKAEEGMLFCDITPPRERVQEFVDVGAIVLDHHAQQADIVARFGDRGRYADLKEEPGVSGAMLAYRHVWLHRCVSETSSMAANARRFAELAGIRDTWQTGDPSWKLACEQAEALRFYPWLKLAAIKEPFGYGAEKLSTMMSIGPILIARTIDAAHKAIDTACNFRSDKGTHVVVINTLHTSDAAEMVAVVPDLPVLVVGYLYQVHGDKVKLTLSMRSRTGYDVGAFCASLGGGGHRAAAGATLHVNSTDPNPYATIRKLVDDYERGG